MKSKILNFAYNISDTFSEVTQNKFAQIFFILFTAAFTLGFSLGKAVEISLSK